MLFLTYWFVLFIAVLYPLYWFVPARRARLFFLLVACAIFHAHFAGPAGVLPIAVLGVIAYLVGLTRNRPLCIAAIVLSAGSLLYYKYTCFLCQEVVAWLAPPLRPLLAAPADTWLNPIPPLAISFFAFELVHYLVDVSRGSRPIGKPRDFALFLLFWPSIVAGPVKRYPSFLTAIDA